MRERARGASQRLAWVGAATVAAGAAVVAVRAESGCTTHQCDPDCIVRGGTGFPGCAGGDPAGGGDFGSAYFVGGTIVWESAPASKDAVWLDYPGARTYVLNWAGAVHDQLHISTSDLDATNGKYQVGTIVAYVSTYQQDPVQNFVEASGQLAEIVDLSPDHVTVVNGTCAEYFLRVVVQLLPTGDGGVEAGSSDASSQADAASDAPRAD